MSDDLGKAPLTHTNRQKNRPTIGLLTRKLTYTWALSQVQGMVDACREQDVNLICFPGGIIFHPDGFEAQDNIVYDLASDGIIDGLIISTSTITGSLPDDEDVKEFYKRFHPRPIVGLERSLPGIPTVLKSEYEPMCEAVAHLIEVHGYRRIAYINRTGAGPHQERYQAYKDTLAKYDIPYDPKLVFSSNVNLPDLTGGGLRAGIDFEAVATSDDDFAHGALRALQTQGVRVPEQVAVTGFDDVAESWAITPPLTTVSPPFHEMGYKAVELLLALLAGEEVPDQVVLPCKLTVRQSCGCMPTEARAKTQLPTEVKIDQTTQPEEREALDTVLDTHREDIVAEMVHAVGPEGSNSNWAGQLLDGFVAEIKDQSPGLFLRELNDVLRQMGTTGGKMQSWQGGFSVLRRRMLPYLDGEALTLADDLWQHGRVMIGEVAERAQAYQAMQTEQQAQVLREVSQELITTFSIESLMDILVEGLPRLNFPGCYLALYETPSPYQYPQSDLGQARLMLAYDERGQVEPESGEQYFPTRQLLPVGIWPDRQFIFVVEPLYFRADQLGVALFEMGPRVGTPYEALRGQISSALKGALLVQQEEKRARQLQAVAEVSTATSTILDTAGLLQQVVDLTKERFGLYHVHIYMLNQTGDTLNLAAGAGEAGREMLVREWRIPLMQKQSLVARAARNRQGIIIDNVQQEPDWLPNPLLPDTCSELAVPMIAGDRVFGVLDIQSDQIGHFTEEDVRIQMTLAAQVAATLQNARLFTEMAQRATELEALSQVTQQLTTVLDPQQLIADVVEQVGAAFNYYYTQIYLFDQTQENLVLTSGTGEVGEMLAARQHSLPKGRGLVGQAAKQNKSVLVPNVQRHIGAEIITPANVEEVYQREVDAAVETEWYARYIADHFGDVEILKDWLAVYPDPEGKILKLGYVTLTPGPFSGMLQRGAEVAARDLQVEVEFVNPPCEGENLPLFEKMVKKKVDGLVVIPDGPSWADPINKGLAAGIPIVTANRSFEDSPTLMHAGLDDFTAGMKLAQELIGLLQAENQHTGKILVGIRNPDRTAGVKHGLRKTNYTLVEIEGFVKNAEALERLWQQALEKHTGLVAVMGLSAFEMPTLINLKRRRQEQWLLVGFDLEEVSLEALRDGILQITIGQHPYLQGYLPVLALVEHLRQNKSLSSWMAEGWLPNVLLPETKAEVAVPIASGDQMLGALDVQHNIVGGLQQENVNLLRSVAGQVAIALTNARLFEETNRSKEEAEVAKEKAEQSRAEAEQAQYDVEIANKEISALNEQLKQENLRMSAELDVARRLQEMILPPPEELQQIEGLDIVGYMKPADEVGGDYYDVLQKNGITHIGIGDVTGHGLESGVLMLMTQTAIRTLIDHGETDPVKFVTTLNRTIYNNVRRAKMDKSLTFALVNFKNGQLKIVGQHEEILVVKANGQVERMDTLDLGLPLGIEEEIAQWVDQAIVELEPGEGIVLYTDGITEAANDKNELYGLERLCEVVSQNWHISSAEEVKQAIVEDVTRHIGKQMVYDDLTMVVLKQ